MTPGIHSILLGCASVLSLTLSVAILARNPRSTASRMHAVYGGVVAWWFFSMAMIASSSSPAQFQLWCRLVHLAIGVLPAVVFHLNVASAGVTREYRRRVALHYAAAGVLILFFLTWPSFFGPPHHYSWGPYPSYSVWGLLPVGFLLGTIAEVRAMYRAAIRQAEPGTAFRKKARALSRGNLVAALAVVDFLPVFGVAVYPPGFLIMTVMLAATLYGTVRYQLIEITPEFAADQILRVLPDGVFVVDSKGSIRLANESTALMLGLDPASLVGRPLAAVLPEPLAEAVASVATDTLAREVAIDSVDGRHLVIGLSGALLYDQARKVVGRLCVLHDLTPQRQAEAEKSKFEGWVRHSQKLETLGVMAGGVAHDFNNLLAVILGNAEIANVKLQDGQPVDEQLRTIASAAERGSELTHQMLRFAGEGTTTKSPVDLTALCTETLELLQAAISKKAELELELGEGLPPIIADKGNIHQVILNLVTNASDALGDEVGTITLRTALLEPREPADGAAGQHTAEVILEVRDSGCGMDPETEGRIFDPFFTTKFTGRGLGLANVMGIVQAHGGRIRVRSELGVGSCFTIALPAATGNGDPAGGTEERAPQEFSGLALVVDDEVGVRNIVAFSLARAGFEVVEAENGRRAVEIYRDRQTEISIVLLDMTMPEMGGKEALSRIREFSPEVPVILMSGYTDTTALDFAPGRAPLFLAKPFGTEVLAQRIQEALAQG